MMFPSPLFPLCPLSPLLHIHLRLFTSDSAANPEQKPGLPSTPQLPSNQSLKKKRRKQDNEQTNKQTNKK
jgi:hypothetical protein